MSIAAQHGFFWRTLWDHPNNAELKEQRKDPGALLPGDRVFIPERELRTVNLAVNQRHKLRVKGTHATLRLRFAVAGKPLAAEPYVLEGAGPERSGDLDSAGGLIERVPVGTTHVIVRVGTDAPFEWRIGVGGLDPADTPTGVQMDLANRGHVPGRADGWLGPQTQDAFARLQRLRGLTITGELDDDTKATLVREDQ